MGRSLQLRKTINYYFILSLIIPLVIVSSIAITISRGFLFTLTEQANMQTTQTLKANIEDFFNEPQQDLMVIRDTIATGSLAEDFVRIASAFRSNGTHFDHLMILDDQGIIQNQFPAGHDLIGFDYSSKDFYEAIQAGEAFYWSNTYVNSVFDQVSVDLAVPLDDGMLVGTIHLEKLSLLLGDVIGHEGQIVGITDNRGVYVAHPDIHLVQQRMSDPYVNTRTLAFDEVLLNGATYFGTLSQSDQLGWSIVLYQDKSTVMGEINQFILITVSVILASIAIVTVFGIGITNRILRDVKNTLTLIQEAAIGQYTLVRPENLFDEFTTITDGFGHMVDQVQQREKTILNQSKEIEKINAGLELRVQERTAELERINEELAEALNVLTSAQKQLVESEKLASLGNLVAGVAHEINTPIGVALTSITYLTEQTKRLERSYEANAIKRSDIDSYFNVAQEAESIILANINQASELISSFKMISADQAHKDNRSFELLSYTQSIIRSLAPKLKQKNIFINLHCDPELTLYGNPGDYSQIVTNLVINSINHGYAHASGLVELRIFKADGGVNLVYRDFGKGIPADNLDRIFEPFFTTTRGSGGSGLGLNIVYNTVLKSFGGSILCKSTIGQGTAFFVTLFDQKK